jgi:glutaredoxin
VSPPSLLKQRNMDTTVIYTKPGCPYCAAAMKDFRARGVPFKEIDAQGDPKAREAMRKLSGGLTAPVIVSPEGAVTVGFGGG